MSKAVLDAVKARLGPTWSSIDGTAVPVFDINTVGQAPADGSPFIEVQFPVARRNNISVGAPGDNVVREDGGFRIILNVARGLGIEQGMGWADELGSFFANKQFDGVNTWQADPPILDNSNDAGNYETLAVIVDFYFDTLG